MNATIRLKMRRGRARFVLEVRSAEGVRQGVYELSPTRAGELMDALNDCWGRYEQRQMDRRQAREGLPPAEAG